MKKIGTYQLPTDVFEKISSSDREFFEIDNLVRQDADTFIVRFSSELTMNDKQLIERLKSYRSKSIILLDGEVFKTLYFLNQRKFFNTFVIPVSDFDFERLNDLIHGELDSNAIESVDMLKDKIVELELLCNKDDVTGLFNQRKLAKDLEKAIVEHQEHQKNFSVLFIDIDHFKFVNDNYGHYIGSQILIQLGDELKSVLRGSDYIYRYGGDEFVVILPKLSIDNVYKVANRIMKRVKSRTFVVGDIQYEMSLSIGIAEFPTDASSFVEIIRFADKMMYISKKSGRGKVFHVGDVSQ